MGINQFPLLGLSAPGLVLQAQVESRRRVELLIFVTPRIIKDS